MTTLASLALAAALHGGAPPRPALPYPAPTSRYVAGWVRAKLSPAGRRRMHAESTLGFARAVQQAEYAHRIGGSDWAMFRIPPSADPRTAAQELARRPGVLYAEPVQPLRLLITEPNEPDFPVIETGEPMVLLGDEVQFRRLWYLDDTDAMGAWTRWPNVWYTAATKPANPPTIAVIDTGVEMDHPDFINAGGLSGDKLQGGQWDKARSKYFTFGEIDPNGSAEDTMGHGTHVAGLALAAGNNGAYDGRGMIGLGYPCQGMNLRVFDDNGSGSDSDAAAALFYAADHGADIINLSLGTQEASRLFQEAITYAWQKGCLVLCAGNESGNGGGALGNIYPAASSGALAVTANGPGGVHADDNYAGTGRYIGVAAPGGNLVMDLSNIEDPKAMACYIYSTTMSVPGAIYNAYQGTAIGYGLKYGYLIGTSMACPIVAGGAGTYMGRFNLRAATPAANLRTFRAIERSAQSIYGAPKGSWETHQGFGTFDAEHLLGETFRGPGDATPTTAGAIAGMVYQNGLPVGNAVVRARRDGSTTIFSTTTSPDGSYRFDQLPEGRFTVTGIAGSVTRSRRAEVVVGSDHPGVDLWAGDSILELDGPVANDPRIAIVSGGIRLTQWGRDTLTGVNDLRLSLGTSPGGTNLLNEVVVDSWIPEQTIPVTIPAKRTVYATLTYENGTGLRTIATCSTRGVARWDAAFVSQRVDDTGAATITFRNTGAQAWERRAVSLRRADGSLAANLRLPVVAPGEVATFRTTIPLGDPLAVHRFRLRGAARGVPALTFGGSSQPVRGF